MRSPALVEIDWQPSARTLRGFGFVAFGVFGVIAGLSWRTGSSAAASGAAFLAAFTMLGAIVRPRWNRPVYVGLTVLSYPIAWLVAWLLLIALFFLVITPIALVYRRFARNQTTGSAWKKAHSGRDKNSYFRQF